MSIRTTLGDIVEMDVAMRRKILELPHGSMLIGRGHDAGGCRGRLVRPPAQGPAVKFEDFTSIYEFAPASSYRVEG